MSRRTRSARPIEDLVLELIERQPELWTLEHTAPGLGADAAAYFGDLATAFRRLERLSENRRVPSNGLVRGRS